MSHRLVAALVLSIGASSCALPEPRASVNYALEENPSKSVPVCQGAEDCEAKWSAARRWVNAHAGFRIQIYSADYIETYWSTDEYSRDLSVRVEREPIGAGRYSIRISAGCRNRDGCNPDARAAMMDFDAAVSGVRVEPSRRVQEPQRRSRRSVPAPERPQPPPNF